MAKDWGNSITFKNTMLFADDSKGFRRYSIGISNKLEDGGYESMYIDVQLPKSAPDYSNKTKVDIEGFLTFRSWKDRNGEVRKSPKIVATKIYATQDNSVRTTEPYSNFEEVEEDIPF